MFSTDVALALVFCTQLSSPHFATRNSAEDALQRMGARALPAVQLYSSSKDPEVRVRTARILASQRADYVDLLLRRHPGLRVDALPFDYPGRDEIIGSLVADHWNKWENIEDAKDIVHRPYRIAVRDLIVKLARDGERYEDVVALLDKMAARQAKAFNAQQCVWLDEKEPRDSKTGGSQ